MSVDDGHEHWTCHGWDDHVRGQLEHTRSLTFRQRMEWLEEMSILVGRLSLDPRTIGRKVSRPIENWQVNETAPSDDPAPSA